MVDTDSPVARLIVQDASQDVDGRIHDIFPNDEFDYGRKEVQAVLGIQVQTISSHHLRFRCVVYESDLDGTAYLIYVRVLSSNPVKLKGSSSNNSSHELFLTKSSGDALLNHGDTLLLTPTISLIFETIAEYDASLGQLDALCQAELRRFANSYAVTPRLLGSGGNASVFVAIKQSTRRQLACKILPLSHLRADLLATNTNFPAHEVKKMKLNYAQRRAHMAREYDVLKELSHPNIVGIEKVFCTTFNIFIFQELITGGDLLSYMEKNGAVSQAETAAIVYQILKAVEYLHSNDIVHRDIKPENVLMTSWRTGARIVLTDFGQARKLGAGELPSERSHIPRMQTMVGTAGYTAPEVYKTVYKASQEPKGYSKAIDVWSVGCVTAILLLDRFVFPKEPPESFDAESVFAVDWEQAFTKASYRWSSTFRKAKSFIRGCLAIDEAQRLTAKQALSHEWFTNRHYAAELEAAYQRAVQEWTPCSNDEKVIECIDALNVVPAATKQEHIERLVAQTKSPHFPPSAAQGEVAEQNNAPVRAKLQHTPLGPISQGDSDHDLEDGTDPEALFASPAGVPNTPRRKPFADTSETMSIRQFAPPDTLYSVNSTAPPLPFWPDSAQSQFVTRDATQAGYISPYPGLAAAGFRQSPTEATGATNSSM